MFAFRIPVTAAFAALATVAFAEPPDVVRQSGRRLRGRRIQPPPSGTLWRNPILRGWIQYYGSFCRSALQRVFRPLDHALIRWVRRKYRRLKVHKIRASKWLKRIRQPGLWFVHSQLNGDEDHRKLRLDGQIPGEITRFRFESASRTVAELGSPTIALRDEYGGQLRVWAADSEHLAVVVEGQIDWHLELDGIDGLCSTSNSAMQRFEVKLGEVVKIVVPAGQGGCTRQPFDSGVESYGSPGVTVGEQELRVDFEELLATHEYALVVKVEASFR